MKSGLVVRQVLRGLVVLGMLLLALLPAGSAMPATTSGHTLIDLTPGESINGAYQWLGSDSLAFDSDQLSTVTLSGAITRLADLAGGLFNHALSPDGSTLAYAPFYPDVSVKTISAAGGTPTTAYSYGAAGAAAQPEKPIWRTDGARIAYDNDWCGGEVDTVPATGGSPTIVMPGCNLLREVMDYRPGRLIVWETDRGGNRGKLISVTEEGAQTVLATDVGGYRPAVSADGTRIAYASTAGDLYAIAATGGTPVALGAGGFTIVEEVRFSPDGRFVAVNGRDSKDHWIGEVANADGSGARLIPYGVIGFGWSPDSSTLIIDGLSGSVEALATVSVDTLKVNKLLETTCGPPVYSPDGTHIACAHFDNAGANPQLAVMDLRASVTSGPQAMEGNLRVAPGTTLAVGYDFTMPGTHPAASVRFSGAQVTFQATCVNKTGGGMITVPITDAAYSDPLNSATWYPSGDKTSPTVYQGSVVVPDLCAGGQIDLSAGGTFGTTVESSDHSDPVSIRWHYRANGSTGGWSATSTVVPVTG